MKEIGSFLLLVLLIISGVWFYRRHQENERKKKELEAEQAKQRELERQKLFDFFKSKLDNIKTANNQFSKFIDLKTGYFTNYQLTTWKSKQTNLFNEIKGKPFDFINLSSEEVKSIKTFTEYFNNAATLRNDFNKLFIKEELRTYNSFFDNIEGRKLDIQQRTAVVTDEDNNIVIAGAGSGKTTTIVGKVNYVLERYKVRPEEILLISFTNKSATTLAGRIDIEGVEAKTFHKFGKDIIVETEGRQPSIFEEAQFKPLLTRYFTDLIKNTSYLQIVTEYFTNFLKPAKSQFEFENQGDYIQYIKDQNFKSYKLKEVPVNGRMTYKMEVVKSIEECKIANFLLFNGVNYEYEFPYEHDTATEAFRQYKPDFTVIQNGQKIYIEHFGISRSGNVPSWFTGDGTRSPSEKYRADMEWKRDTHRNNGTTLIESYSYEMSEGILFENLTKNLKSAGVVLNPKSPDEIWKIISEAAKDEINSFITLFGTFITLMKSNNYSINDVIKRNQQTQDKFFKDRNALFIEIIKPIFERYENHLKERNEIDFSDMINKASKHIASGKHKRKFSYVIIDEFQDISIGRYQLVKAIKTSNPSCKLFCVGDDWQSIYRFSGSDIALFKEFENYFGFTVKSKIETTYRFHNPLISLSSEFIQKNPNQAIKELKGISSRKKTEYKIHYSVTDNQDDTLAVQKIFNELLEFDEGIEDKEIIILGRYGFDIDRIKNEKSVFQIDKTNEVISYGIKTEEGEIKRLKAQFMTVHKAKGLEGDIIIVHLIVTRANLVFLLKCLTTKF
ncbi:UvrD-helicase domain-containing protein [Pedobacter sp. SL55]|uniref:UvrD-helicase domain-containing protein n=1 Tax=Pedobacter sp. SL55 TaxID=2995161 RepID=UPI002270F188|nr:UvrD-helicase domain-containing protein [Pedobacter sp. SL55]WAC40701.1 UvrD-helicase domain-containing protein [Pedobacter sp. SL55]